MHVADPLGGHTSKTVDQSPHELRMHAVEMGGRVIDQLGAAVKALLERDVRLAEFVLSREPAITPRTSPSRWCTWWRGRGRGRRRRSEW